MRHLLRTVALVILLIAIGVPAPGPAQPSPADTSKFVIERVSDLQSMAQQLAEQQGQFAGRSIGPQFASATNQLLQVLLNFDVWACGTSVTALHLKRQRLAVAAAAESPADPALDKAVDDFGRLISQLQELCDRYVHRIYGNPPPGGGTATSPPPPPVEEPPPPTMTVQERICYDRCRALYVQYLQAELDFDRARREAERARARAATLRQHADEAARRAQAARQQADDIKREYDQQQAALTAAGSQAERLRIAERLAHLNPERARQAAADAQRAADEAARSAQQAEDRAARSETEASALYDAMSEIYQAWQRCAQACAEQARVHDRVTVDPHHVFTGMPQSLPQRPPFYRPAPAQTPRTGSQSSATRLNSFQSRILSVHNAERAAVGAPPLRWDVKLEADATAYAQQLARIGHLVHAPREGRGIERENLSAGLLGWGPDQLMRTWINEKRAFRPGIFPNVCTGEWSQCAHYSQMIWPTTTDIGCGKATGSGRTWLVCRYSPGGNKDGKPVGTPEAAAGAANSWIRARLIGGDYTGRKKTADPAPAKDLQAPPPPVERSADSQVARTDPLLDGDPISGFVGPGLGTSGVHFYGGRVLANTDMTDDELVTELIAKVPSAYAETKVEPPLLAPTSIYPPAVIDLLGDLTGGLEPM